MVVSGEVSVADPKQICRKLEAHYGLITIRHPKFDSIPSTEDITGHISVDFYSILNDGLVGIFGDIHGSRQMIYAGS